MRFLRRSIVVGALGLWIGMSGPVVMAGEPAPILSPPEAAEIAPLGGWIFEYRPYLWTASLKGDLGVAGMVMPVDIGFDDILDNLDFAFANTLDIRHTDSPWGAVLDFSYLKMSPSIGSTPGPLFSTIGIDVEMTLFDAMVTYRALEWDRGYLDLLAGMRYTGLDMGLRFSQNPAGIADASENISAAVVDQVSAGIRNEVSRQVNLIQSQLQSTLPQVVDSVRGKIKNAVSNQVTAAQALINQRLGGNVPPNFGSGVAAGAAESRIRDLVDAQIAEQVAETQAKLSGVRSTVLRKAQEARKKAEKKLARELEKRITDRLPDEVGGSESWWDPHVGIRAQHFLTEKLYLGALFDVGGFGVGSDIAIQAGGGLGYHVTENFSIEALYRYLKTDYSDGGFVYDTEMTGIFLGGVFHFGGGKK